MLQHCGKVFFKVSAIDRKGDVPTIFLDVIEKSSRTFIGQIRYNNDAHYENQHEYIRMAFDVVDPRLLDPTRNSSLLEDIVVPEIMKIINSSTIDILTKLGCYADNEKGVWFFSQIDSSSEKYISSIINRD